MARLKELPLADRPREKMIKYGPDKLSEAELLALVLGSGTKGMNVKTLATKILKEHKKEPTKTTIDDLLTIKGLGQAKASQIMAVLELGKRLYQNKQSELLLTPKDVWERCEDFRSSKKEHFVVFYLDSQEQQIKRDIVTIGTLNESLVHPREVFENAIRNNAASVIVAHNHPSGELEPSMDDIEITQKLLRSGKLLDIQLTDHLIVTKENWKSIVSDL